MTAIDTNVWIYWHDVRDPVKQNIAAQVIATTPPLALPWQVGCEFVSAARKLIPFGFTEAQAWAALHAMVNLADATSSYSRSPASGLTPSPSSRVTRFRS